jgi:hypothetical protein
MLYSKGGIEMLGVILVIVVGVVVVVGLIVLVVGVGVIIQKLQKLFNGFIGFRMRRRGE